MSTGQKIFAVAILVLGIIAVLPGEYRHIADYWLERVGMIVAFGAVVGVVLLLIWLDLRTPDQRRRALKAFIAAARAKPMKLAFRFAFMVAFFLFLGGLFLAALGWEPLVPYLGWRIWTLGAVSAATLMMIGWLTDWD